MGIHMMAMQLIRIVEAVKSIDDLTAVMTSVTAELGFQYFALTHHVDVIAARGSAIRLHNYPSRWADYYDGRALGVSDPVHRAAHVTSVGFCWSKIPEMIPMTATDRRMLAMGREEGIGDGFTVPVNVPGEARGSCSFANDACRAMPIAMLPLAQLAGAFAFESARRLWLGRGYLPDPPPPPLTDRQRDCVLFGARGNSDWEIGRILGIGEQTVIRHMTHARERYGVHNRTLLAIRALFDGTITFTDILKR
jgi:LuxR family quorum-sensing system transcriptional regulator CciR